MNLQGNRTLITGALLIGYIVGGKAGWWPVDGEILAAAGTVLVMFLRLGVKAAEKAVKEIE